MRDVGWRKAALVHEGERGAYGLVGPPATRIWLKVEIHDLKALLEVVKEACLLGKLEGVDAAGLARDRLLNRHRPDERPKGHAILGHRGNLNGAHHRGERSVEVRYGERRVELCRVEPHEPPHARGGRHGAVASGAVQEDVALLHGEARAYGDVVARDECGEKLAISDVALKRRGHEP